MLGASPEIDSRTKALLTHLNVPLSKADHQRVASIRDQALILLGSHGQPDLSPYRCDDQTLDELSARMQESREPVNGHQVIGIPLIGKLYSAARSATLPNTLREFEMKLQGLRDVRQYLEDSAFKVVEVPIGFTTLRVSSFEPATSTYAQTLAHLILNGYYNGSYRFSKEGLQERLSGIRLADCCVSLTSTSWHSESEEPNYSIAPAGYQLPSEYPRVTLLFSRRNLHQAQIILDLAKAHYEGSSPPPKI